MACISKCSHMNVAQHSCYFSHHFLSFGNFCSKFPPSGFNFHNFKFELLISNFERINSFAMIFRFTKEPAYKPGRPARGCPISYLGQPKLTFRQKNKNNIVFSIRGGGKVKYRGARVPPGVWMGWGGGGGGGAPQR